MINQMLPLEDFVYCYSTATFLKLTEKTNPEFVIIDLDLAGDNRADLLYTLHEVRPATYVLALAGNDLHDYLFHYIEKGLIDDYLVKPVTGDDLVARILIASRIKSIKKNKFKATEIADQQIDENDLFNPPMLDEYLPGSHNENTADFPGNEFNIIGDLADFENIGKEAEVLQDDEELFGMKERERAAGSSTFEELFGMTGARDRKKGRSLEK